MRLMIPFAACLALSLSSLPGAQLAASADPVSAGTARLTPHLKGPATYYFGANAARTTIAFESKTSVTNILGKTNYCSGSVEVDFEAKSGRCHLVVPAASLNTGMDDRDRAMHAKTWLDSKVNKTIEFKSTKAEFVKGSTWKIEGDFTLRGVTKSLSIEAEVKQVPPALGEQLGEGAWIRVKTGFKVNIADHGFVIDKSAQFTVEPTWTINIELFATTVKPPDAVLPEPDDNIVVVRVPKLLPDGIPGVKYEFGKKPQLTTLRATSRTPLETVDTVITASHGFVGMDKEKGLGAVRLHVPVAQLKTGIPLRDEHLKGPEWLDEKNHKLIFFESSKATKKNEKIWTVEGTFKMHGVEKPLTLDVEVVEIPAEDVKKANWGERAGLRITGEFNVKLSDFGIKVPQPAAGKVSDTLNISIFIVGLLAD